MNRKINRFSPDRPQEPAGAGTPVEEELVTEAHQHDWRGDEEGAATAPTDASRDDSSERSVA